MNAHQKPEQIKGQSIRETACIAQGPHSIMQGPVVNRLPGGRVVIRCNGRIRTGLAIPSIRRAS
jgi:hypothetical protein